jgi:hypothetical protein
MRRTWIFVLTIALLMTLASVDFAAAKKSRSGRSVSRSRLKSSTRQARDKRQVSRRDKRSRGKYAVRTRRGRKVVSSRRSRARAEAQEAIASNISRPAPGISTERVTEIQNALIKAGYLDGPASGQYDDATIEAMKRFQADSGLSRTGLPSAAVLKKLGVSKRSNDGYAVPVNRVSETEKKSPPQ